MGCFGRNACISAAIFTLVEAGVWTILSTVGLLVYYCAIHVGWNDITIQYFYNPDSCHKDLNINIPHTAKKTGFILIYYTVINLLWIATSLAMLGGACRKLTGLTFYPWFVTVIITLLSDVAVMILFILDLNEDVILSKKAAILMAVVSIRVGLLWLINIIVLRLAHKSYLQEGRDRNRHTKKVADGPELPTHSNWIFAADHIRQNGKNQFEERETPYEPFSPGRQDMPHGKHVSPISDPVVGELRKRLGEPNWGSPYRREPNRDESSGWNSPNGDRERWNGPPKFEALVRQVNQQDSPYHMEPKNGDQRRYNNGPNKSMDTPHYKEQSRLQNFEPGRRSVPHSGGQERGDVTYHNRPPNDGYFHQNAARNVEPRRWTGDNRDDSLRPDHRPHALSSITSGGRRYDIQGGWENSQVHDKPYRRDDHRNNRGNAPQSSEETRVRRDDSVKSDADSVRSEEVKRTSNTTPPKGLHNQYPWSYVLPQINSALALKKKQLKPITDDKMEDEERPPVPVPDYTLHFNRQCERPVLNRTSSDASSQPRY